MESKNSHSIDVFSRYAPFIQEYIYRSGWKSLRGVQNAAGQAIFGSDDHVLLCASTASGKTEAAFFPILTLLEEKPSTSVGVLYIAPLKALINDQFGRLNELCQEAGIPVTRWHGDASTSQKAKLIKHPAGILQITPESLESLLINKHAAIPSLFGDLRFIVIDEIHSLLRGDRGLQTFALIQRLCRTAGCDPRRIGLSATMGDPLAAGDFLAAGTTRRTVIPRFQSEPEVWQLSMEQFYDDGDQADYDRDPAIAGELLQAPLEPEPPTDQAPEYALPSVAYIFEHTRGHKSLIFTNSREDCELLCQLLREYCAKNGEEDRFLIHHGNLSAAVRQDAEEDMKDDDSLKSICATATLELGIDVGKLDRAFQAEAPATVSGFLQRMGRTGRRGQPSQMWFVMAEHHLNKNAEFAARIPWSLIQGIALVQLYTEERFVEPPRLGRLPYSLLYHQTMSTLKSNGEMTPAELASRVLTLSPFSNISTDDYRELLTHLIKIGHIELTEHDGIILGTKGERVVNDYKFYVVFKDTEEYTVHYGSQQLGTVLLPPPEDEKLAIAGHVWKVKEVDWQRNEVYVEPTGGNVPAFFGDEMGDIHTRILERMRDVLAENTMYPYLMRHARFRLQDARSLYDHAGLADSPLIHLGGNTWALFPWLGTYSFTALQMFLSRKCGKRLGLEKLESLKPYYIMLQMEATAEEFFHIVTEEAARDFDPLDLLGPHYAPRFEKYDKFIPPTLLRKGFAYGVLDVEEMKKRVLSWAQYMNQPNSLPAVPKYLDHE